MEPFEETLIIKRLTFKCIRHTSWVICCVKHLEQIPRTRRVQCNQEGNTILQILIKTQTIYITVIVTCLKKIPSNLKFLKRLPAVSSIVLSMLPILYLPHMFQLILPAMFTSYTDKVGSGGSVVSSVLASRRSQARISF